MKILFINTFFYPNEVGGAEISTRYLTTGLKNLGHDVHVIVPSYLNSYNISQAENIKGVFVHRIPSKMFKKMGANKLKVNKIRKIVGALKNRFDTLFYRDIPFKKNYTSLLKYVHPDIVHINNVHNLPIKTIYQISQIKDIKIIQSVRDPYLMGTTVYGVNIPVIGQLIRKMVYKYADVIHFTSIEMEKMFYTLLKKNNIEQKNVIIPNTVGMNFDEKLWLENVKKKSSSISNEVVVCFVGRLTKEKGIDRLISWYFSNHKKLNRKIIIKIIGDGNLENWIKEISETQVGKKLIQLKGRLEHQKVLEELAKSHVVILPGTCLETFGRVLIEGFYMGALPIGRAIGGIPEVINDKELVFNSEDELTDIFNKISSSNYYFRKMQKLKLHMKFFSYEKHIKSFEKFYLDLLKSRD